MVVGDVEVDTARGEVKKAGQRVNLTAKEYAIAELLVLNRGKVLSRERIYDHVYDGEDDTLSNVVDVHLCGLRKKLGKDFVATRRGQGYVVDDL